MKHASASFCLNTYAVITEEWDQWTYKFAQMSLREQPELDQLTHKFSSLSLKESGKEITQRKAFESFLHLKPAPNTREIPTFQFHSNGAVSIIPNC